MLQCTRLCCAADTYLSTNCSSLTLAVNVWSVLAIPHHQATSILRCPSILYISNLSIFLLAHPITVSSFKGVALLVMSPVFSVMAFTLTTFYFPSPFSLLYSSIFFVLIFLFISPFHIIYLSSRQQWYSFNIFSANIWSSLSPSF